MSEEIQDIGNDQIDMIDIFASVASSNELPAGVHSNVKLISIGSKRKKDNNGVSLKKQLFLKFKKYNAKGEDVGEKDISFFIVDPTKDSAINNLYSFISQTMEILSIYLTEKEIEESFDPLSILPTDGKSEEDLKHDFNYENIKVAMFKQSSSFTTVEQEICDKFNSLLENKIGMDSVGFRFKLEESKDAKYVQIPRFDRFIERASVEKSKSVLY